MAPGGVAFVKLVVVLVVLVVLNRCGSSLKNEASRGDMENSLDIFPIAGMGFWSTYHAMEIHKVHHPLSPSPALLTKKGYHDWLMLQGGWFTILGKLLVEIPSIPGSDKSELPSLSINFPQALHTVYVWINHDHAPIAILWRTPLKLCAVPTDTCTPSVVSVVVVSVTVVVVRVTSSM